MISTALPQLSDSNRLPLLITGVSGVAGYNLYFHLRKKYGDQVFGQRPEKTYKLTDDGIFGTNLSEPAGILDIVRQHGIRTVVNCGGSCHLRGCELDPEMAQRVNVQCVANLLDAIDGLPVRLIHLSIDLVYSGEGIGDYVETDPPDPVSNYGKTMVQAERLVRERRPEATILRISLPMGVSFNGHAGAIDWIQSRFARNLPATLYFDEIRTPTYVECLNDVIEEVCCRDDMPGIFHTGGPQKLSLYQIAQIVNVVGGYDSSLLHGCPRIDAGPIPPRAGNVSMNSEKLGAALGRKPFVRWPLLDEHLPNSREWHLGSAGGLIRGSAELIQESLYRRP